jgi:hypothetical protein
VVPTLHGEVGVLMAKAPANTRLTIWCTDQGSYDDWKELEEMGHTIVNLSEGRCLGPDDCSLPTSPRPDLIVGDVAMYWTKGMKIYRDLTLRRARADKRAKKVATP